MENITNQFIKAMSHNNSKTFNDMPTNDSSLNPIIDLFFLIGATRTMSESDIISIFNKAYQINPVYSLRILYYARDIEKGLGERRVFRVIMSWLISHKLALKSLLQAENIIQNIIRVDDLVYLANELIKTNSLNNKNTANQIIKFLFKMLDDKNVQNIVAKWMPRKNSQYGTLVRYMRSNGFINSYSEYRHKIVGLTDVVEQKMSANEWNKINLEHVPSIAMKKYKKAFKRHEILEPYIAKVVTGEAKINASKLFPYDIIKEIIHNICNWNQTTIDKTNRDLLNEQWKNLAKLDQLPKEYRAIPVIDVSGSMIMGDGLPISIALGLGFYMAENNPNENFKDAFITFSDRPKFQMIFGHDIVAKVENALKADWAGSTNLEAVFKLILSTAVNKNIPENDMPTHIIIISDMEFNQCIQMPNDNVFEMITRMYYEAGYEIPKIIFWNVNGRIGNIPVQVGDKNALLVSGASQNVINFIMKKGYEDMMQLVIEVVENPRYQHIKK